MCARSIVQCRKIQLVLVIMAVVGTSSMVSDATEAQESVNAPSESAKHTEGYSSLSSQESPAQRGFHFMRTQPLGLSDLPIEIFDDLWHVWPDDLKSVAASATPDRRRAMAFERYGMIPDPANPGIPLGVADNGQGNWVMNCLSCHQGSVAGKVYWGVPNTHYAFQTLVDDVTAALKTRGVKIDPLRHLFPLGATNGTTNAQIFSVFLSSFRDRDLNYTPLPRLPKFKHHDLDAPPFWNTKRKRNLYIDGFVPKTHRVIMQFTLVPSNSAEEIKSREDNFRDILAWIESLEAPKYPWAIDRALAKQGEAIFNESCADCHGTYGPNGHYPELRVPIEEVGTDPVRLTGMPPEHRRFYRESWFGNYGELEIVDKPTGYVAPPLDGVWASAPYFHNGSVPTLWHLMNPSKRPVVWTRANLDGYDTQQVGLEVVAYDKLPNDVIQPDQKRIYFDTTLSGKSAAGHNFPDSLDEQEKRAVIEYLKTL